MLFLHKILTGVWMIEESFAANYLPYVTDFLKNPSRIHQDRKAEEFLQIYNSSGDPLSELDDTIDESEKYVAVISVSGAITKHDQFCGPDGMQSKAARLRSLFNDDYVKGIVLKIDSGGGEGTAMRLMSETLKEKNKPVVAFVDDLACSAAYGIATACDYIVANSNLAQIGSIGTYLTVADYEKYYEKQGVKLTEIYATLSTDKNKDYYEAIKGNVEPLRQVADKFNEAFIGMIEKNREGKLTADRKTWGTGKVWFAQEAIQLGLIDEINTFSNILNSFV